jgi:DNA-binding transcriptional regulator LsrR (DeoR family)
VTLAHDSRQRGGQRHDELLADVARAYYEQELNQHQVAEHFGVSRSQVSRYLREARQRDIVQIRIVAARTRDANLEADLRDRFPGLREVVVAQVFTDTERVMRNAVARAAAHLLDRLLKPGQTVCLGAGRTMAAVVDLLVPRRLPGLTVAQAAGNAGLEGLDIDYGSIASSVAGTFDAVAYRINAPAILGRSASAAALEQSNRQIRDALAIARSADLYMVGMGSLTGDEIFVRTGLISLEELAEVRQQGAVGDLCGHFFDASGRSCPGSFLDRVVGIRLEDLRRASIAIACAAGDEKVPAIAGALRGRLVNTLVTDEHTARGVLVLEGERGRRRAAAR